MAEKLIGRELDDRDKNFSLKGWLSKKIFFEKLNNPLGYAIFILFSLGTAYIVGNGGKDAGIVLLAAVAAIPVALICIFHLEYGIYLVLIISYFILGVLRFVDVPLGLAMDALIALMFFGLFVKQIKERDWSFARNAVSTMIVIWIFYNIIQVVNPVATSRLAWVYTIRGMAGLMVLYYIALYAFKSLDAVATFLKIWIALSLLAALYGIWQEFHGLADWELHWIMKDKDRFKLFFNWGRFRKFSFFSNPTIFGILMGHTALLCFVLMTGPFTFAKKIILGIAGSLMVSAMVYTGTRTAYAMIPAGFLFFALLTARKNVLITIGAFFLLGSIVVFGPFDSLGPINSNNLARIRSTFNPSDDPSFNVRAAKHEKIQPYIRTHPIGGGLGSVGVWGIRFSPHSPLSKFGPDSGFVRVAVELGWIGLGLYLFLMFTVLRVGIKGYYRTDDPLVKTYLAGLLTVFFSLIIANYPQQAITMFPTMVIFYIITALIVKVKDLEKSPKSL